MIRPYCEKTSRKLHSLRYTTSFPEKPIQTKRLFVFLTFFRNNGVFLMRLISMKKIRSTDTFRFSSKMFYNHIFLRMNNLYWKKYVFQMHVFEFSQSNFSVGDLISGRKCIFYAFSKWSKFSLCFTLNILLNTFLNSWT